jgi:hypothetical protein
MILSQSESCSPRSLGRRRVVVEVGVGGVVVGGGVGAVLLLHVLLLWILLLGAKRRAQIRIPGSEEWWDTLSSSLDDSLLGKLMGLSDIFIVEGREGDEGDSMKKRGGFRGHQA